MLANSKDRSSTHKSEPEQVKHLIDAAILYLFPFRRTIIVFAVDLLEFHELEFEKNEAAAEEAVRPDTITKYTLLDAKIDASVTITLLFKLELSSGAEKLALFQNDGTVNPKTSEYHASCFLYSIVTLFRGSLVRVRIFLSPR